MDPAKTKIPFPVNSLVIRDSLEVPPSFTLKQEEFVEEYSIQQFRHADVKQNQFFYSKCFEIDVSIADQPFPLDVSLFNEESHLVVSMLS